MPGVGSYGVILTSGGTPGDRKLDITEVGRSEHTRRKTVRNETAELRGGSDVGLKSGG